MTGSTISSTITTAVTLGYGGILSPLTIAFRGEIDDPSGYGILIPYLSGATVTNDWSVIAGIDGIYLQQAGATIYNQAFISGSSAAIKVNDHETGQAVIVNDGTLTGGAGVAGLGAEVINSGVIYGTNTGINLQLSTIVNDGTISGQDGVDSRYGTLTNNGSIAGHAVGVYISGGTAVNYGGISGTFGTGARVASGIGAGGVTVAGSLTNHATISGGIYAAYVTTGRLTNDGELSGRIGLAVGIGGSAGNAGTLSGTAYGAELKGQANMNGASRLSNTGSITGGAIGVILQTHATLANAGYVYGANYGVTIYNGYLTNSGRILNANIGVSLASGVADNTGTIDAFSTGIAVAGGQAENYGTIDGATNGAFVTGGSFANFANISGGQYGIMDSGANVTNYGVVSGATYGVEVARAVLTNAGTISGKFEAVSGSFITLAVYPGAVFDGQVTNLNGKSLLELAGTGVGSLGGIGSQITGFREISFAAGPQWSIEGNETGLASGETIVGFAHGDTIVLDGFSAASESYVRNTGLELVNGSSFVTLDITGNFSSTALQVIGSGSQTVIVDVTCFAEGTRIATPDGEVAVEALKIGDPVWTLHGGARPVKWIGRRAYDGRFIRGNKAVLPVRIKAGAIADGVPSRDLFVSPGHAISIDDVLVHAGRLVNGVSVVQVEDVAVIRYVHVELENHEILLADNCPAESFMDEHFRAQFENAAEYPQLYPGALAPMAMCQPRLDSGFQLYAIQRRLRARAGIRETQETGALCGYVDSYGPERCFGWAADALAPESPVSLDILGNGRRIGRVLANLYRRDVAAAGHGDGFRGFEFRLPAGAVGVIEVRRSIDGALLPPATGSVERAA